MPSKKRRGKGFIGGPPQKPTFDIVGPVLQASRQLGAATDDHDRAKEREDDTGEEEASSEVIGALHHVSRRIKQTD